MTPTCSNCNEHVSTDYVRVFSPDDETINCCPNCSDRIRGGMLDGDRWRDQGVTASGASDD